MGKVTDTIKHLTKLPENIPLEAAIEAALLEAGANDHGKNAIRTADLADMLILMGRNGHSVDIGNDLTFLAATRQRQRTMEDGKLRDWTGTKFVGSIDHKRSWDKHQWALPLYQKRA
jgi:hypothetical protein